jgi:hypothetical protein
MLLLLLMMMTLKTTMATATAILFVSVPSLKMGDEVKIKGKIVTVLK